MQTLRVITPFRRLTSTETPEGENCAKLYDVINVEWVSGRVLLGRTELEL